MKLQVCFPWFKLDWSRLHIKFVRVYDRCNCGSYKLHPEHQHFRFHRHYRTLTASDGFIIDFWLLEFSIGWWLE
jgi:hypothetical protein